MSIVERSDQSSDASPNALPPRPPGGGEDAPSTLSDALGGFRRRILTRVFLRWYWVCALLLDTIVVAVLWIAKPALTGAGHLILIAAVLLAPMAVAGLRCIAVRLPSAWLAKLIDERGGLQERVASAVEATSAVARAGSQRMLSLLTQDALEAVGSVDLRRLIPLKRDAILAAVALAASLAICFWRAPEVFGMAIEGKGGGQPSAFDNMTGERHIVSASPNARPTAPANPETLPKNAPTTPVAPNQKAPPQKHAGASSSAKHKSQAGSGGASKAASQNPPQSSQGQQSGTSGNTGKSAPGSHPQPSQTGAGKGGSAQSPGNGAQGQKPGQQNGSSTANPHPGQQSGAGSTQHPGQQGGASHLRQPAGKSGSGEPGKPSPTATPGSSPGQGGSAGQKQQQHSGAKSNAGGGKQAAQNGGSSKPQAHQQNGNSSNNGKSGSNSSPSSSGKSENSHTGGNASRSGSQNNPIRSGSDTNQNSSGGPPPHPDAPFATGGQGKPLPIQPRNLAPVANRSTFSYRLPKPTGKGLKEVPDSRARQSGIHPGAVGSSKVPYGSEQVPGSVSDESPQINDVEQNPRIPAAYRTLVKQYFANPPGHAH